MLLTYQIFVIEQSNTGQQDWDENIVPHHMFLGDRRIDLSTPFKKVG